MKVQPFLKVSLALTIFGACHQAAFAQAQEKNEPGSAELSFITAGIAEARARLQCGKATITVREVTTQGDSDFPKGRTEALEVTTKAQWNYQPPLRSLTIEHDTHDRRNEPNLVRSRYMNADDKTTQTVANHVNPQTQRKYSFGTIAAGFGNSMKSRIVTMPSGAQTISRGGIRDGFWADYPEYDPRYYAHYLSMTPLDEKFNNKSLTPKYLGEDKIDGSRCMKVEIKTDAKGRAIYWIDVEHSFVVRRRQDFIRMAEHTLLDFQVDVPKLQESNGIWMPASIVQHHFTIGKLANPQDVQKAKPAQPADNPLGKEYVMAGDYMVWPTRVVNVTISEFKASCDIPAEKFMFEWPVGTNITDAIRQMSLFATAVTKDELKALNEIRKDHNPVPLTGTTVNAETLAELNALRTRRGAALFEEATVIVLDTQELNTLNNLRREPAKELSANPAPLVPVPLTP